MEDQTDHILFFGELPPERRAAVREAIERDPELARAAAQWQHVQSAVRTRMKDHLPPRRLLVLYALDDAGHGAMLSMAEQEALAQARPQIQQALAAHPSLENVVARIQDDQDAFETVWAAHFTTAPSAAAADTAPRRRTDRAPQPSRAQYGRTGGWRWAWRLAAVAAVVLVAVLGMLYLAPGDSQTTVATGPDEVRQLTLADGSTVRLMADSRLTYDASEEEAGFDRTVMLDDGRAFFEVVPAEAPFRVETPTARATVRGTSFGIETQADETQVVLASGRLEVANHAAPEQAVMLQPGEASRVARDAGPTAPEAVDIAQALAWTDLFIFRDTPMETITDRLAQHYETSIAVDPSLRNQAVTGTFEQEQPLDEILNTIAATLDVTVVSTESGYRITPSSG